MLEKIEIENFRNIKKLSFEPKKINLILGPNNTGKTTLLEAILISLVGLKGEDIISKYGLSKRNVWERLFFLRSEFKPSEYDLFFKERETPFKIRIKLRNQEYEITLKDKNYGIFNLTGPGTKTFGFGPNYSVPGGNITDISYCFLYPGILNEMDLEEIWAELDKRGKTEKVKEIIKKYFGIESLEFSPLKIQKNSTFSTVFVLHYKKGTAKYPIFLLGSGARISIAISLLSNVSDVVLFDDFEIALHPDTIEIISDILREAKTQFFITTQSKEVVRNLVEKMADTQILYFYKDGSYSVFSRKEAKKILETTGEIR